MNDGSLEYIANDVSVGLPVADLTPANVPALAVAIWGVSEVKAVEAPRDGTRGEWVCRAPNGQDGVIYFWLPTPPEPNIPAEATL